MMGSRSGWTMGEVTESCSLRFFGNEQHGTYAITCAYRALYRARFGDSGGPVFSWGGGNDVTLEGVNFGWEGLELNPTAGWFAPVSAIEADLGTTISVVANPTLPPLRKL